MPRDQSCHRGTQSVDRDIGPRPTPPWHERLVVLVQDREEKAEGPGQSDISPRTRPCESIENHEREHKEDRKLGGMPTLDNCKPTVSPEDRKSPERRLIHEDIGGDPGEEVMRQDNGARCACDEATPRNRGDKPKPQERRSLARLRRR